MKTSDRARHASVAPIKLLSIGLALSCLAALPSNASIVNGDFGSSLTGWTRSGDVAATSEAMLGDNGEVYSLLYQAVALAPGQYRLEFDFLNLLSSDLSNDPNAFLDTLFTSLYFINDLAEFDLAAPAYDDVFALMDLDASGESNVSGVLSSSTAKPGWTHFALNFTNNYNYAIPVFELLDFNMISGDSSVHVDNVTIAQHFGVIPEPATVVLIAMGVAGLVTARKHGYV